MKTKEFIKRVKNLGFEIRRAGNNIDIMFDEFIIAGTYTDERYVMYFYPYRKNTLFNKDKLFDLLVEYAKTPVDEREEDTKDKLLNEINRILNYVKDFDNKGLMEVLNSIEKLEDDLEIFANDLKYGLVEVEE